MSIFEEMHRTRQFGGWSDYQELIRMLGEATDRGQVQEITPSSDGPRYGWSERWFLEKGTGTVFRLVEPDPPAAGEWSEVEFPDRAVQ